MADTTKTQTAPKAPVEAPAADEAQNTREEVRAAISLLRYKLSELERDAKRARPFLSRTQDEAKQKFTAAVSSVIDFAQFLDKEPTH